LFDKPRLESIYKWIVGNWVSTLQEVSNCEVFLVLKRGGPGDYFEAID